MLEEYDKIKRKGLSERELLNSLSTPGQGEVDAKLQYEGLAWTLVFTADKNEWGTHYGPCLIGHDKEGNRVEYPSRELITPAAVEYWVKRCGEVVNPFLKVRYCGLVWDYYRLLPNQQKPSDLYERYTSSLLELVRGDYLEYKVLAKDYIQICFELVKTNPEKLAEWKEVLHDYVASEPIESTHIGIGCTEIDYINSTRDIFTKEERQRAAELFRRRYAYFEDGHDFYTLKELTDISYEYYFRHGEKEQAYKVLMHLVPFIRSNKSLNAGQREFFYATIAGRLRQLQDYKAEENDVMVMMHRAVKESIRQLKRKPRLINIPKEKWDSWVSEMTSGSKEEQYKWFVLHFLPNISKTKASLVEQSKDILWFNVPTKLYGEDAPGSTIPSYNQDKEGNLVMQIARDIQMNDALLVNLLQQHIENKVITEEILDDYISRSPLIDEERKKVMQEIVKLYFDGQYMVFSHMIVPPIEAMIRNLLQWAGVNVLQSQYKESGYQYITLDQLLREPIIDKVFNCEETGFSVSMYLRVLLTDQRGCNYRNIICHGLVNPASININVASRLLHAFMFLLFVHLEEK